MSGLKINFHKNEIFYYGQVKEFEDEYIELFGCNAGEYPFRYLGIPMHHRHSVILIGGKSKNVLKRS